MCWSDEREMLNNGSFVIVILVFTLTIKHMLFKGVVNCFIFELTWLQDVQNYGVFCVN